MPSVKELLHRHGMSIGLHNTVGVEHFALLGLLTVTAILQAFRLGTLPDKQLSTQLSSPALLSFAQRRSDLVPFVLCAGHSFAIFAAKDGSGNAGLTTSQHAQLHYFYVTRVYLLEIALVPE